MLKPADLELFNRKFCMCKTSILLLIIRCSRFEPDLSGRRGGESFLDLELGRGADNQNGNLRWLMAQISRHFLPHFFLLQLNPTYMKRILHLKNITFKSSYNWFKIDIHQQLRPLTANYLAMFKVISTTIYT